MQYSDTNIITTSTTTIANPWIWNADDSWLDELASEKCNIPRWSLLEGVKYANFIEKICIQHGAHCSLGGSVLHKGYSYKDLDIMVYPHQTHIPFNMHNILLHIAMCNRAQYKTDTAFTFATEYIDKKVVIAHFYMRPADYNSYKRVDFFFV